MLVMMKMVDLNRDFPTTGFDFVNRKHQKSLLQQMSK